MTIPGDTSVTSCVEVTFGDTADVHLSGSSTGAVGSRRSTIAPAEP